MKLGNLKVCIILLVSFFTNISFVFSADGRIKNETFNFYNKVGDSKINLISSTINQTTLEEWW